MPIKKYHTQEERDQAKVDARKRFYYNHRERILEEKRSNYDPTNTSYKRNPVRGRELYHIKAPYFAETRLFRNIELERVSRHPIISPEQRREKHLQAMRNYINRRTEFRHLCAIEV